jgi:thiosulfate/3-mercaptopyruvate sulfurtransferase
MSLHWFCVLLSLPPAQVGEGKAAPYPKAELLVEAADLARPEAARQFHILDARPREQYLAGHLPNAAWVDHADWSKAFAAGQDPQAWQRRLGELGISTATRVVVYDDSATKDAARIWWILRYWGVRDVRLLNGGWQAWKAAAGRVVTDEPLFPVALGQLTSQADRLATKDQVLAVVKNKQAQIIDARSREEYCGEATTAKRNGAIPGAVHLEWSDVIDPKSQRFKSAAELTKLFQEAGIDLRRPAVTHCQSGGRSSVMAFALELMGAPGVRNYYRSWAEWGNADDTPIEKPTPKK